MRILVVDDQEVVRKGICSVLETDPKLAICGEAVNGQDAVEKAVALRPDVVIMDIGMAGLNGLEAAREIKGLVPKAEIVIVSRHEAPQVVRHGFDAGAREYPANSRASSTKCSG